MVTVLIVVYNYGRWLTRALESALNQTLPKQAYEVVVVDDGSVDDTPAVLQRYEGRVQVLRQEHAGLPAACNRGIEMANGAFLVRLDADDELEPEALAQCASVLQENPDVGFVYTDRTEFTAQPQGRRVRRVDPKNIYSLIAPGIMFRRQALMDAGMYREFYWEEHDLLLRLLAKGHRPHYLETPLYRYYLHGGNMTASTPGRRAGWQELINEWGIEALRRWGSDPELEDVYESGAEPAP